MAANLLHLLAIPVGLVVCFYGYRLFKFALVLGGLAAGAYGGWWLGMSISPGGVVPLVTAVIGALVGAALAVAVFKLGVFLLGAGALFAIGHTIFDSTIVALVLAVVGGFLAVLFQKYSVMIATAYGGASAVGSAIEAITHRPGDALITIGVLVLGTVGLLVQIGLLRKRVPAGSRPA